jgi:hypothetical protein
MALSTKNLDDKKTSKVLQPGDNIVELVGVKIETVPYKEGAYHVNLTVQGPDLGKDFEGFFLDVKDEKKGRYHGQVGRVRANEYPYADGETKTGIKVYRDNEMMKCVKNLCAATNATTWFDAQDGKHDTIEQFIAQFDTDKPFKGKLIRMCIAGREYQNKQGYTNYDLFIPRPEKGSRGVYAYESADVKPENSKVFKYNAAIHITKQKPKKTDTVTSFEKPVTEATKGQFSLD